MGLKQQPESQRERQDFMEQIGDELDMRISELEAIDEKKSNKLERMQGHIQKALDFYSGDLAITRGELSAIFFLPGLNMRLKANGINNFEEFQDLIGMSDEDLPFLYDKIVLDVETFDKAKEQNPEMTADEYMDMLVAKLDTPQKVHDFLQQFMRYTYDRESEIGEHWQPWQETISRIENGKMLGDCDDFAFLAREILRRQGKNAHTIVINPPSHAVCIWVEERSDGRYDAYSIGTFGLDKNGQRYRSDRGDKKAERGFEDVRDAINSLMGKYRGRYPEFGNVRKAYQVEDSVVVIRPSNSETTDESKLRKEVPIESLINGQLIFESEVREALERHDIEMVNALYEEAPEGTVDFHERMKSMYNYLAATNKDADFSDFCRNKQFEHSLAAIKKHTTHMSCYITIVRHVHENGGNAADEAIDALSTYSDQIEAEELRSILDKLLEVGNKDKLKLEFTKYISRPLEVPIMFQVYKTYYEEFDLTPEEKKQAYETGIKRFPDSIDTITKWFGEGEG